MLTVAAVGHEIARGQRTERELLARYEAYRLRQGRALLRMVPPEAIRPLYRRARTAGLSEGGEEADPMATLVRYCGALLPLPPFQVWCEDLKRNPTAHLYDVDDSADAPNVGAPVTVETREFTNDRHPWTAHLRSFRDGVTWRGFIAFEDPRSNRVHRTALIFQEADPVDVRDRFLSFESSTLVAFLRSALP